VQGSLCLSRGVLYVGVQAMTAHVRAFDLDGEPLEAGFSFRAPDGGRAAVSGLALDEDHRLWVADAASRSLRAFTLFGAEVASVAGVASERGDGSDRRGELGVPVDVVTWGSDEAQELCVASGGERRHALQMLSPLTGRGASLRSLGDPNGRFRGLRRVARSGRFTWVCEPGAGRVQVFRDGEFHFQFRLPVAGGAAFEPRAVALLADGRAVLAHGGEHSALLLVDASGRLLAHLAAAGDEEGSVREPNDVVVEPGADDRATRVAVIDSDGERIQVFTLGGRCYGSFASLPGAPA